MKEGKCSVTSGNVQATEYSPLATHHLLPSASLCPSPFTLHPLPFTLFRFRLLTVALCFLIAFQSLASADCIPPTADASQASQPAAKAGAGASPGGHYAAGLKALEKRDLPTAVRELRMAVMYAPKSAPVHNSLGLAFEQ